MINESAKVVEENVMEVIEADLDSGYRVATERGYETYFKSYIPDMIILREFQRIPEDLREIEHIENFFHESAFELPIFGIEVKYREGRNIHDRAFQKAPRGPPPESDDSYPEVFLILNQDAVPERGIDDARNEDWIITTDLTDHGDIHNKVCSKIISRLSEIEGELQEEIEEMDEYIENFRSKVYHFSEVLRGYQEARLAPLLCFYRRSLNRTVTAD